MKLHYNYTTLKVKKQAKSVKKLAKTLLFLAFYGNICKGGDNMLTEKYLRDTFARNLKNLLAEHEKTQSDLVHDLGFRASTVCEWVNGRKYPRVDKIQKLATYFNCRVTELVGTDEDFDNSSTVQVNDIGDKFNSIIEDMALKRESLFFDGTELDQDDIALLRLSIASLRDIYRVALRNKYKKGD